MQFTAKACIAGVGFLLGSMLAASSGAARADDYGATAAGISGSRVGVGVGYNYSTQAAADAKALQECEERTNNCRIVGRFSDGGCGYITTAIRNGTCYGYGASVDEARSECQKRGCGACQPPVGSCTKAP